MHQIKIYGEIVPFGLKDGTCSIENLNNQLSNLQVLEGDNIFVGINTFGGNVEAGLSMYNILRRFSTENKVNVTTRVDGFVASIGTAILLAGDKRIGNEYSYPFVHDVEIKKDGNARELSKASNACEQKTQMIAEFYSKNINIEVEKARELMRNETFISPEDAIKYGFFTEIENQNKAPKEFLNLLKNNNNQTKTNMTAREKFSNFMNEFFGAKNKIVFDFENVEIDFYEIGETDEPKVGDKANYKGQPANGEILAITGQTMVFDNGTLIEIIEVADDSEIEALKAENQSLKEKIESLENAKIEMENSAKETTEALNKFKNLYSDFQIEESKQNGQQHQKTTTSAFSNALKNLR